MSKSSMKRIMVVGTSGSGKTTLADTLSERLGLPRIELDALFWEENWSADRVRFERDLREACAKSALHFAIEVGVSTVA